MDSPADSSSPRPHRFRSTAGCLTCRRRKKKCDQTRPRCTGCARNHLTCNWPPVCKSRSLCRKATAVAPSSSRFSEQPLSWGNAIPGSPHVNESSGCLSDPSISWSRSMQTFLSPTRATMLTPISDTLLAHYLSSTGPMLSTLPARYSPFLNFLVPLALNDDLLMHSLLALSGTHLSYQNQSLEIQRATGRHYGAAISALRQSMFGTPTLEMSKTVKILITLLVLAFFETLSNNVQGAMFFHLRAGRPLMITLMENIPRLKTHDDSRRLYSFAVEIYSYLVLANTITPLDAIEDRKLPFDSFLSSLGDIGHQFESFGAVFGGSHGLFELLPSIAQLSSRRLTEIRSSPSSESWKIYETLHYRIKNWTPPTMELPHPDPGWLIEANSFLNVYRHSVSIYLETAMHPLRQQDDVDITTKDTIQGHLDAIMLHASSIVNSPFESLLLWPTVIAGSCMTREEQRTSIRSGLHESRFQMGHCYQAALLLEHVWRDPDERIFGPYGLSVMMKKHGINLGIA